MVAWLLGTCTVTIFPFRLNQIPMQSRQKKCTKTKKKNRFGWADFSENGHLPILWPLMGYWINMISQFIVCHRQANLQNNRLKTLNKTKNLFDSQILLLILD